MESQSSESLAIGSSISCPERYSATNPRNGIPQSPTSSAKPYRGVLLLSQGIDVSVSDCTTVLPNLSQHPLIFATFEFIERRPVSFKVF